jgi:hypothetical protein
MFKNLKFQDKDSRTLNQIQGLSDLEAFVTTQVTCPGTPLLSTLLSPEGLPGPFNP